MVHTINAFRNIFRQGSLRDKGYILEKVRGKNQYILNQALPSEMAAEYNQVQLSNGNFLVSLDGPITSLDIDNSIHRAPHTGLSAPTWSQPFIAWCAKHGLLAQRVNRWNNISPRDALQPQPDQPIEYHCTTEISGYDLIALSITDEQWSTLQPNLNSHSFVFIQTPNDDGTHDLMVLCYNGRQPTRRQYKLAQTRIIADMEACMLSCLWTSDEQGFNEYFQQWEAQQHLSDSTAYQAPVGSQTIYEFCRNVVCLSASANPATIRQALEVCKCTV